MERSDDIPQNAVDTAASLAASGAESVGDVPDWSLVHFDVACARCGHDLRGRSEPKCPACQLEFDWADAVPLEKITCGKCDYHLYGLSEARCPECGEPFDWNEALLDYRRRQKPLFEYRWREQPIRSLIRTWWMALRPGKFWRSIDIHDPPHIGPLVGLLGIALLCLFVLILLSGGVILPVMVRLRGGVRVSFDTFLRGMTDVLRSTELYGLLAGVAFWYFASVGALLLLRQSMRLCKVRPAHVVRVCTYALGTLPLWIVGSGIATLCGLTLLDAQLGAISEDVWTWGVRAAMALWFAHGMWSIRAGYKYYIRMPHAFLVAFLSQLVAGLATMLIFVLIRLASLR